MYHISILSSISTQNNFVQFNIKTAIMNDSYATVIYFYLLKFCCIRSESIKVDVTWGIFFYWMPIDLGLGMFHIIIYGKLTGSMKTIVDPNHFDRLTAYMFWVNRNYSGQIILRIKLIQGTASLLYSYYICWDLYNNRIKFETWTFLVTLVSIYYLITCSAIS